MSPTVGTSAVRALFFLALLPGTVAVYVPLRLLRATGGLRPPDLSLRSAAAAALLLAGLLVLLRCVWDFYSSGGGTLAPVDPPRRLVVSGLYRYTRNPMYNGVLLALVGQAWLFRSGALLEYAGGVFVCMHAFVVLYEERALQTRFGPSYSAYRSSVPRWGFAVRPYAGD